jgi:SET domain-containing protein
MKSHSYLSPKCVIKKSELAGKGVFAAKNIQKDELVALWGGLVYSANEVDKLSKRYPHFSTHTVSVFDNFYLGPIKTKGFDDTEFFNHSCEPNIGVKGQIVVVARQNIKRGEELCFDYDTTETCDEGWFYCNCKSKSCRKKIDGSAWKDRNFIKKNKDYISWYILEKIK